jgi:predicted nucleotidyltransferase
MDKALIIAKLREHEPELKAAGVEHLFLHGSYARGTARRELSDVDLIAEFDTAREYSLLDRVRLENRLADMLGVKVDLAPARMLKDDIRERAAREAVLAF